MSKRYANYRKIYQEYYGCSDEDMRGMDVHHIDGNRKNNNPENLLLVTPEEHAQIHNNDFIMWARDGAKKGNRAYIERLRNEGPTEKEKIHWENLRNKLKSNPLHKGHKHRDETRKIISQKKKELLETKSNHPMWGRTTYEVISPDGKTFIVSGGWKCWCAERGLSPSNLRRVALGKSKHHKGYTAKIIDDNHQEK